MDREYPKLEFENDLSPSFRFVAVKVKHILIMSGYRMWAFCSIKSPYGHGFLLMNY